MHLGMKNGEETAKKFFIVVLEIITARETKLFLSSTGKDFTQKGSFKPVLVGEMYSGLSLWKK